VGGGEGEGGISTRYTDTANIDNIATAEASPCDYFFHKQQGRAKDGIVAVNTGMELNCTSKEVCDNSSCNNEGFVLPGDLLDKPVHKYPVF